MYRRRKSAWQKHGDFMILDTVCLQLAYIISFCSRHGWVLVYSLQVYRNLAFVTVLAGILIGGLLENYKNILRRGYFEEFKKVVMEISLIIMVDFTFLFITQTSKIYSRIVITETWILGIILVYFARLLRKEYVRKRMRDKEKLDCMLIVSTKESIRSVLQNLQKDTYKEYYISGIIIVDDVSEHNIEGIPVVAGKEDALSYMQNHQVDRVYIDLERDSKAGKELLKGCNEMGITVHYVLSPNSIDGKSVIEQIGNSMVVTSSLRFASSRDLMLKRIMDIVGGIVGCILTGILTVIIGPIIYVQSPGPIFFSQKRVGQNGRIFRIYKFRSMYPDAEERKKELMEQNKMKGHMFKMDNDPRIIPIGHFIRKTSLDEFPQFWNVLKGDMSLVGTRPPTVDEYEKYERHHKARLATKPGLTGMWQVTGRSDIVDFEEVVQLDMNYIQEWNLGLDIKIIFKTVKNMFTGKGSV